VPHPPCINDHLPPDHQLLGPLKNADEDSIVPMMGQCRMPSTVAADEEEQTISGYEYMFLFKGGKQM